MKLQSSICNPKAVIEKFPILTSVLSFRCLASVALCAMRSARCSVTSLSDFRIFSRGIVLPYRTTTGPTSEFCFPMHHALCPMLTTSHFHFPPSEFSHLSSVLCPLSSVLCHLSSVICLLSSVSLPVKFATQGKLLPLIFASGLIGIIDQPDSHRIIREAFLKFLQIFIYILNS